mmetsp:Transcript_24875/g.28755  ORF Transcript_24875/g.28755 Transcript_24875/m.28755 type:complete len:389 (+) Transcript_24875:103-1269(+)
MKSNLKDPSLLLSPHPSFKCGETFNSLNNEEYSDDEEIGPITFYCTIPVISVNYESNNMNEKNTELQLYFRCRNQSVGFLHSDEPSTKGDNSKEEQLESVQETIDPNFFDKGYTLAGKTGFQIWAGSRIMIEGLLNRRPSVVSFDENITDDYINIVQCKSANNRLQHYQNKIANGANILELGAGVGVVGSSFAAMGGNVLLTDLPTLVDCSLLPNLMRNETHINKKDDTKEAHTSMASWLGKDSVQIHSGYASATSLDWTKPLSEQLSPVQIGNIDIIIACDCVWLVSMLDGLLDTVASVFEAKKVSKKDDEDSKGNCDDVSFLMSFQRRDTNEGDKSTSFTTVERVLSSVEARGWRFDCLAWKPVLVEGVDNFKENKEVFIFEIIPL